MKAYIPVCSNTDTFCKIHFGAKGTIFLYKTFPNIQVILQN